MHISKAYPHACMHCRSNCFNRKELCESSHAQDANLISPLPEAADIQHLSIC